MESFGFIFMLLILNQIKRNHCFTFHDELLCIDFEYPWLRDNRHHVLLDDGTQYHLWSSLAKETESQDDQVALKTSFWDLELRGACWLTIRIIELGKSKLGEYCIHASVCVCVCVCVCARARVPTPVVHQIIKEKRRDGEQM
jgi:hypothetical protein